MRLPFVLAIPWIVFASQVAAAQRCYPGPIVSWPEAGVTLRRPLFFVDARATDDNTRLAQWRGIGGGEQRDWYVTVRTQPGDKNLEATRERWLPTLQVPDRTLVDHGTLSIGTHRWLFFESHAGDDDRARVAFTALAARPGGQLVEIRVETTRPVNVAACRRFTLDLLADVAGGDAAAGLRTWLAPAPFAVRFPAGWAVETTGRDPRTHRATAPDGSVVDVVVLPNAGTVADAVRKRAGPELLAAPEPLDVEGGTEGALAVIAETDATAGVRIGDAIVIARAASRVGRRAETIVVDLLRGVAPFDADAERRTLAGARTALDAALEARPVDGPAALAAIGVIADRLDVQGADAILRRALAARPLVAEAAARALARRPFRDAFAELKRAVPTLVRRKRPATLAAVLRAVAATRHPHAAKLLVRQLEHPHAAVVFAAVEGIGRADAKPVSTFPVLASFWAELEKTAAARPQMKNAIAYDPIRDEVRALLARWASTSFATPDDARAWFTANRRKLR